MEEVTSIGNDTREIVESNIYKNTGGKILNIKMPNTGSWLNAENVLKIDSLMLLLNSNLQLKLRIAGNGNFSNASQLTSWANANKIITYLSEVKRIDRTRFIFNYGQNGKYRTVDISQVKEGEDGPNNLPPPHLPICE
jgi:hypothetical protein